MLHWISKRRLLDELLALHAKVENVRYLVQTISLPEPPKPREKNPKRVEAGKRAWTKRRERTGLNGVQLPLNGEL